MEQQGPHESLHSDRRICASQRLGDLVLISNVPEVLILPDQYITPRSLFPLLPCHRTYLP
jgi:hypothetical protein